MELVGTFNKVSEMNKEIKTKFTCFYYDPTQINFTYSIK